MYVLLASGGYRAVSAYDGFAVTRVSGSEYVISDLAGDSANYLASTYSSEANADAALATFMQQFPVVVQPASD
jgi:hypothetical protein